jgi:hypothetical protein
MRKDTVKAISGEDHKLGTPAMRCFPAKCKNIEPSGRQPRTCSEFSWRSQGAQPSGRSLDVFWSFTEETLEQLLRRVGRLENAGFGVPIDAK